MPDIIKCKVLLNGSDYSYDLANASIKQTMNEFGDANVKLANDDSKYTLGSYFALSSSMVISASRDGTNYARLFDGYISDIRTEVNGSDGSNFITIGGSGPVGIRNLYIGPNQVVIGPCEMGRVFTGSPTDSRGVTWNWDSKGNYPNGLLYKTGYGLTTNSTVDVFATQTDLPSKIIMTGRTIFEVFNFIRNTYAMTFFLDEQNKSLSVYRDPIYTNLPTTPFTLSEGDLLKYSIEQDTTAGAKQVLVVGSQPNYFAIKGTGSGNEYIYYDNNIDDYLTVYLKASQQYEKQTSIRYYLNMETYPLTESVVGKKIALEVPGLTDYGNVIGVTHNISPNRWTTEVSCEAKPTTEAKLFSEILTELKSFNNSESAGQIYLYADVNRYYGINSLTPVAIGVGVGAGTTSGVAMQGGVAMIPLTQRLRDTKSGVDYCYLSMNSNYPRTRIREFVLYGTPLTDSVYTASQTISFPYVSTSETWRPLAASLSNAYPFSIESPKTVDEKTLSYYWWKPINFSKFRQMSNATPLGSLPTPASCLASGTTVPLAQWKDFSIDDGLTHILGEFEQETYVYVEIATEFPTWSFQGINQIDFCAIDKLCLGISGSMKYYIWSGSTASGAWKTASGYGPYTNTGSLAFHSMSITGGNCANYFDDEGVMRLLVMVSSSDPIYNYQAYEGSYMQMSLKGYPLGMGPMRESQEYCDSVSYDPATKFFFLSNPINQLKAVWLSGTLSGSSIVPIESTKIWGGRDPTSWRMIAPNQASQSAAIYFGDLGPVTLGRPWGRTNRGRQSYYIELIPAKSVQELTSGTNGIYEYIEDILATNRFAIVSYSSWVEPTITPPQSSITQPGITRVSYNDALTLAVPYIKLDETTPAYGTQLVINYSYLGGGPLARMIIASDSRIDQGIDFDGRSNLHLMVRYNSASTGSGKAYLIGHGCGLP